MRPWKRRQPRWRRRESILDSRASTSPIDGIAGKAQVQIGNLVSPPRGPITTVSTLDPIKAEFTVSEQEYLKFTRNRE